jgi:membrane protein implicated in regulation of membrane protease activity
LEVAGELVPDLAMLVVAAELVEVAAILVALVVTAAEMFVPVFAIAFVLETALVAAGALVAGSVGTAGTFNFASGALRLANFATATSNNKPNTRQQTFNHLSMRSSIGPSRGLPFFEI